MKLIYVGAPMCSWCYGFGKELGALTARLLAPQADLLSVFRALQHAFYVDGLDTTDGKVLAQVAPRSIRQERR